MRVALIGSTGFIGQPVARWLIGAGHEVFGIQRGSTSTQVPGVRGLTADHHDLPVLASALARAAPAVVVEMVAYTEEDTDTLTAALPGTVRRLITISSGDVYWTYDAFRGLRTPGDAAEPLSETAPLREQLFPYRSQATGPEDLLHSYEKILVEQRARAGSPVPVTILRLPMVYGPRDQHQRVGSYLKRLAAGSSLLRLNPAEAQWRCTRGYVEDVAWAIALAVVNERATGEVYNVGEPEALTELEWAEAIAQAAGWQGRVVPGGQAAISFDSRDTIAAPTSGVHLTVEGAVYPGAWDVASTFGEVHGEASTYLNLPLPLGPVLALRAGGKRVWGEVPFQEAAFIGGASTVRGLYNDRYAGDASAYGNAELRFHLFDFGLPVPGQFGLLGLADAGRVWLTGESSGTWHHAFGGGIWLDYLDRRSTVSAVVARAEGRTGFYMRTGFAF